ncbi:hypothetical protein JOD31_000765 [Methylopila capsulata]|uniref:DUF6898 domain-containing protein n=1 Tax=Methylopila capsulata TaxID=61654 RepID=A0A9W6IUJ6_9HYPH|nr:hypothetical protein [Methylopila capsulata]MBM7850553.1 hypothetical protein [Methylopila capsulata]GLK55849.1 hypothetical protein GCM10008170_18680 [Methylopila capsulata]
MTDGRPRTPSKGGGPAVGVSGEVLFEFITRGGFVRCAAIDGATGIEVVVVGPTNASQEHLKRIALRKLQLRLARD